MSTDVAEKTTAGSDVEVLEGLDFTPETPCVVRDCTQTARWAFVCQICADTPVLCDGHHDSCVVRARKYWQCNECSTIGRLFELYRIVPWGRS